MATGVKFRAEGRDEGEAGDSTGVYAGTRGTCSVRSFLGWLAGWA